MRPSRRVGSDLSARNQSGLGPTLGRLPIDDSKRRPRKRHRDHVVADFKFEAIVNRSHVGPLERTALSDALLGVCLSDLVELLLEGQLAQLRQGKVHEDANTVRQHPKSVGERD